MLSDVDDAWLLNLEKDPDELKNFIDDPEEKETVAQLAKQLKRYAEKTGDAKVKDPHTGKVLAGLLG
jgi:N-acetylglucosamine kinase-like BadF-type ATPase